MICCVCNKGIEIDEEWFYHARLNVFYHAYHDNTDIMGEDVSMHTVTYWGGRGSWI